MLLGRDEAATWARCFQSLGDPSRILILHLLATSGAPMTVGEITDALDIGQSTVSHHLKKLADVRFVLVDHDGNSSYYRVNERCVAALPTAAQLVMGQVPARTGN
jgi:ArsR family transcriptional regulator